MQCRICNSSNIKDTFTAKEMLEGSREAFVYFVCDSCGTVQIESLISDMAKYYNESYYSLEDSKARHRNWLIRQRDKAALLPANNLPGRLLNLLFPIYREHAITAGLMKLNSRLLDVGCGNGEFVRLLHGYGFRNLMGVEPYLKESLVIDNHCKIIKGELGSVQGRFDIIRIHHVLEHVMSPKRTLEEMYALLESNGRVVITIPVSDYIFSVYRENAYLIQAPHHFSLFTISGISQLARETGFRVDQIFRNARGMANWIRISELWKRNITEKEALGMHEQVFSKATLEQFRKTERQLISEAKGDNVTLILKKQ